MLTLSGGGRGAENLKTLPSFVLRTWSVMIIKTQSRDYGFIVLHVWSVLIPLSLF